MKAKTILPWARRFTLVVAIAGAIYLWNRYEFFRLPQEGCSPVLTLSPGGLLLLDRYSSNVGRGDVVFFTTPQGQVGFGRCSKLRKEPTGYWLTTDNAACPGQTSEQFGWILPAQIRARLLVAF